MTTRSRPRPGGGKTYTAQLYQRAAPKPTRQWPAWLSTRHLPALLTVVAEAGHLAAALMEWPVAPTRGLFHIVAAAGLGLLAAVIYFGHSRVELVFGIVFLTTVSATWPVGIPLGLTPYLRLATPVAGAVLVIELSTAALLYRMAATHRTSKVAAPRRGRKSR